MATLKSKEFKKKYATSMDNIPEKGVWSGRGIGIPVAGAIGGGDDYKQKIGRGKLPDFRTGRPTQGADSTFSSYLARVNTGYDDVYLDIPMFPEQEAEDEDIYYGDEPGHIRSRKLPKDFKIKRPKIKGVRKRGITEMTFEDDEIVNNSRYSLSKLSDHPDTVIAEEAEFAIDIEAPRVKDIVVDVLGDATMALADSLTGDVSGLVMVIPAVATNLWQLSSATNRGEELIEQLALEPSDTIVKEMDDIQHGILRDIVDLVQRIIEALPAPGFPEEWLSFTGGIVTEQALSQLIQSAAASGIKSFAETYREFITGLPKAVRFLLEWGPAPLLGRIVSRGVEVVGAIHEATREYKEMRLAPIGEPTVPGAVQIAASLPQLGGQQVMELEELRRFIRESVYPDYPTYHKAQPIGYEYRSVPTVVSKEEADSDFETLEDYDEFAVAYKTDGGVVAYQDRNKLVKEAALRSIIRRKIASIIAESKKKENN
jgi:hypothetical protein